MPRKITRRQLLAGVAGSALLPATALAKPGFLLGGAGSAGAVPDPFVGPAVGTSPPLSVVGAKAFLTNITTGTVVYATGADAVLGFNQFGSCAKMMTMTVAVKYCGAVLNNTQVILASDVAIGGTSALLQTGDVVTLVDLIGGAHVPSGNDAATALARYVGDYIFANPPMGYTPTNSGVQGCLDVMNIEAALIGATNTVFHSPDGISGGNNTSTCRDMARIANHAYLDPIVQAYSTAFGFHSLQYYGSQQSWLITLQAGTVNPRAPYTVIAALEQLDPTYGLPYTNLYAAKGGTSGLGYSSACVWNQPNGDFLVEVTTGATVHNDRRQDITSFLWTAIAEGYTSGGVDSGAIFADVVILVGAETGFIDESNAAHTINETSVTRTTTVPVIQVFAMSFDGATSTMTIGNASDADLYMGSGDFTVDIWFRGTGVVPTTNAVLFGKWDVATLGGERGWGILSGANGPFCDLSSNGTGFLPSTQDASLLPTGSVVYNGARRHARLVRSGSSFYTYYDGVRGAAGTVGGSALFNNSTVPTTVGCRANGAGFDMLTSIVVDELRLIKGQALTTAKRFTPMPIPWARS